MRKLYFLLLFLFSIATIHAQSKEYKKEIIKANDFLQFENYNKAAVIYDSLLTKFSEDEYIQFKAGECFLFSEGRLSQCVDLLEKAIAKFSIEDENSFEAIEARYYLGQAYHLSYRFEDALKVFKDLKEQIPLRRVEAIEKVEQEIKYCNNSIELKENPVEFKITNLGPVINTEYDEHSPVVNLHEDLLLFTSNRETEESLSKRGGLYNENVYYSLWRDKKWIATKAIDTNTKSNNATIGISSDGGTLLVYQNDGIVGNIYISKIKNDKWGELEKLPSPINTMANETHASFSLDGNTLFFTSDRIGGIGGKDIYKVSKLPNGEWGKAQNLGSSINTELDEESPYVHPNKNTLYFSSEGHKSMGGFDIFKATLDTSNVWGNVKNIGYPINTPFDDMFYAPTIDEQRVYYASKRDEGFGGSDIYLIEFPGNHPKALTVVGGFVFMPDGKPARNAKITVRQIKSGQIEGVYRPNPNNGKYIYIIPSGKEYEMKVELNDHEIVIKNFKIHGNKAFARSKYTFYLDPLVLKKDN